MRLAANTAHTRESIYVSPWDPASWNCFLSWHWLTSFKQPASVVVLCHKTACLFQVSRLIFIREMLTVDGQKSFPCCCFIHGVWECPLVIKATADAFLLRQIYTRHATNNFRIYHYIQSLDVLFTQLSVRPIYLAQLSSASGRQTIPLTTKPKTISHHFNVTQPGRRQLQESWWTAIPVLAL